jgi:ABC-type amino acid transport substrate-binding protein
VAEQAGVKDIKLVFSGPSIPTWLACSPATSPDTLKALDEALAAMRKDGSYDKILAKYDLK